MSRSILKSSNGSRLIPIPANEAGSDLDCSSLNEVKPWSHVDDMHIPMTDIHEEMRRIQENLDQMRLRMMVQMPAPPKLTFDPMIPPPLPPPILPPLPLPDPLGQMALPDPRQRRTQLAIPARHAIGFGTHDVIVPPPPPPPLPSMPPMLPLPVPGPTPTITEDEHGNRFMELVLDLKGFLPEDIHIHTEGTELYVHARRLSEKRDVIADGAVVEGARVAKDCRRRYTLPEVVRAENLRCFVNAAGQLTIEGALGPEIVRRTNKKKVKFVASSK